VTIKKKQRGGATNGGMGVNALGRGKTTLVSGGKAVHQRPKETPRKIITGPNKKYTLDKKYNRQRPAKKKNPGLLAPKNILR